MDAVATLCWLRQLDRSRSVASSAQCRDPLFAEKTYTSYNVSPHRPLRDVRSLADGARFRLLDVPLNIFFQQQALPSLRRSREPLFRSGF